MIASGPAFRSGIHSQVNHSGVAKGGDEVNSDITPAPSAMFVFLPDSSQHPSHGLKLMELGTEHTKNSVTF